MAGRLSYDITHFGGRKGEKSLPVDGPCGAVGEGFPYTRNVCGTGNPTAI